ncbi:hypothetical protein ABZ912_59665 [Nonomuraea angiospora]|uniref:hypothetical protein n=1 Tax=Nonomuraea angiospora TaxID=46172 RepID=UPI0033EF1B76
MHQGQFKLPHAESHTPVLPAPGLARGIGRAPFPTRGLPGHATAWGTIGDAGFVARHGIAEVFGRSGFLPMTSGEALTAAGGLIAAGVAAGAVSRYDRARCRAALKAEADVATRLSPLMGRS